MAIINLDTGEETNETPVIPANAVQNQEQRKERVIYDLDTGEPISNAEAVPEQTQAPVGSLIDAITEPLTAVAAQAVSAPFVGIAGGISALANRDAAAGGQFVREIQDSLERSTRPRTQAGQQGLETLGDLVGFGVDLVNFPISGIGGLVELISGQGVEQAANTVKNIQEQGLGKTAGARTFEETGSPTAAMIAEILPEAALEATGFKGLRKTSRETPEARASQVQTQAERDAALIAKDVTDNTGVDLFKAQQTLNPTDIERQAFVAQLPEGAANARTALGVQNQQALTAVDSVLNQLAPASTVGGAAEKFRTAAQKAVEVRKQIRREIASPIYKQAFRRQRQGKVDLISTDKLQTKIDEMSKQFDQAGQIAKNLNEASKKIRAAKGNLQKLHNAKLEIDQTINAFGEGAVGNTTKRFLTDVVTDLTDELTTQSPSYRAAKSEFERLSGPVNKIQDSPIGRVANLDDNQLKQVARQIFDPAETNPAVIRKAKEVIEAADPEAWNAILRAELERRMGSIRADIGDLSSSAAVENIPSQLFNSIFGNKKSRDVLFNSVDGETKKNLKYLETALRRATKGRPGGSQTGIRSEISRELKGGIFQSLRDFIKTPINAAAGIGEEAAFNARVRALSDAMFDATWRDDMKELRSLSPASSKAKRIMDRMLNSALIAAPAIDTEQEEQ